MKFHSSFERCVSRVLYKKDWATARPGIMRHNQWPKCSSAPLHAHNAFRGRASPGARSLRQAKS